MFEELNGRLTKVKNQQQKRRKWKDQLADYKLERQEKQQTAADLKSKIEQNKEDIEKLKGLSFTYLLAVLTSSTDERIQKERNEMATAKLKYDESQHALSHIESAIKEIQEKINALPDIDCEYQDILKEKEKRIKDARSPLARQYMKLSENVADLQSFFMETSEAISAGEKVAVSLTEAINTLKKAEGWGVFDMLGGNAYASYVKHNHIDDAKESIHAAQIKMRVFQKELLDVHQDSDLDIEISGLLTFADFFFDGIFVDSIVQGKIKESLRKTEEKKREIDKIVLHLKFRYDLKQKEFDRLEIEKKRLLENFGA